MSEWHRCWLCALCRALNMEQEQKEKDKEKDKMTTLLPTVAPAANTDADAGNDTRSYYMYNYRKLDRPIFVVIFLCINIILTLCFLTSRH